MGRGKRIMAEIRKYHTEGEIECDYCVRKQWVVHRYDVVESGTLEEMRAAFGPYEDKDRVRQADGSKPAGYSIHHIDLSKPPTINRKTAFEEERERYKAANA